MVKNILVVGSGADATAESLNSLFPEAQVVFEISANPREKDYGDSRNIMPDRPSGSPRVSLALSAAILLGGGFPPSFGKGFDARLERQHPHFQMGTKKSKKKRGKR